jgi:hypothetical protein
VLHVLHHGPPLHSLHQTLPQYAPIHSHPASVHIAYKQKGNEHMYLITDAMRAKGMEDGE